MACLLLLGFACEAEVGFYHDERLDTDEEYQHSGILATGCPKRRMQLVAGSALP